MAERIVLGDNDVDDVRWLCSLNDSELDLLMGLKQMVLIRAKKIGQEPLANKFDLKMLRTLSFIFMDDLKKRLNDLPMDSTGVHSNLLNQKPIGDFANMSVEDLYKYICPTQRKRIVDEFLEGMPPKQKQRTGK